MEFVKDGLLLGGGRSVCYQSCGGTLLDLPVHQWLLLPLAQRLYWSRLISHHLPMLVKDLLLLFLDRAGGPFRLCLQLESDERALLLGQDGLLVKLHRLRADVLLVARRAVGAEGERLERLQGLLVMA